MTEKKHVASVLDSFAQIPEKEYRPEFRWWLAEGMHTDVTLHKEMQQLDEMGIGAVEFLAMDEWGIEDSDYGWGSEEWVHDSHLLVEEAAKRKMGISMTSGTNWCCANLLDISPDDKIASKELDYMVYTLKPGETWSGTLPKCELWKKEVKVQELVAVIAAKVVSDNILEKETLVLTDMVKDGTLTWTAPEDGTYQLFFFWMHGTGQTANPSSSISYAVNYVDKYGIEAVIDYWNKVVLTPKMRQDLLECGRGMLYMDSLEVFTYSPAGRLWGYHVVEEFLNRRGYDIIPYLPFIVKQGELVYTYQMPDKSYCEKICNDLHQTMTELYMENVLKPLQEWLHTLGLKLRAEISYGLPYEISLPAKYVDGVETESLEFGSQLDCHRGLAGAAHIYNRPFSCETGATLSNYMLPLDFYNQIVFAQFAAGVSRTVFHGYSSICGSEAATEWPGHEGMWPKFGERFGPRQPAYRHYPQWTAMLARFQKMLRVGKPRVDLGILRLDYYFNNSHTDLSAPWEEHQYANEGMRDDKAFYWQDMNLQHNGYTWDYFAPQILEEDFTTFQNKELYPDGPGYRALIIYQEMMPLNSAKKLLALAKNGLPVVFVNGTREEVLNGIFVTHQKAASRTAFLMESEKELADIIAQIKALPNVCETDCQAETLDQLRSLGVMPRTAFEKPNSNILTCMKQTDTHTHLFVYNMKYAQTEPVSVTLHIAGGGRPSIADCWSGEIREISGYDANGATDVTLTLNPGEATMLVLDPAEAPRQLQDSLSLACEIPLDRWDLTVEDWNEGEKKVNIEDRGHGLITREVYFETKKTLLEAGNVAPVPWKDIPAIGPDVSGVGFYKTCVEVSDGFERAVLELGGTNGSTAAVYINGQAAEAYNINKRTLDVTKLLKQGTNEILVEVSSTLNNRLLQRGFYATAMERSNLLRLKAGNETPDKFVHEPIKTRVRDYGLVGSSFLRIYK